MINIFLFGLFILLELDWMLVVYIYSMQLSQNIWMYKFMNRFVLKKQPQQYTNLTNHFMFFSTWIEMAFALSVLNTYFIRLQRLTKNMMIQIYKQKTCVNATQYQRHSYVLLDLRNVIWLLDLFWWAIWNQRHNITCTTTQFAQGLALALV